MTFRKWNDDEMSWMGTGKVLCLTPLWSMVLIILKNNDHFNINSIVISHYRIIPITYICISAFQYFYDVRTNLLLAETIYFLIEKTFPKFRMKFMFIIVGN